VTFGNVKPPPEPGIRRERGRRIETERSLMLTPNDDLWERIIFSDDLIGRYEPISSIVFLPHIDGSVLRRDWPQLPEEHEDTSGSRNLLVFRGNRLRYRMTIPAHTPVARVNKAQERVNGRKWPSITSPAWSLTTSISKARH
jgi:hypothetical protein